MLGCGGNGTFYPAAITASNKNLVFTHLNSSEVNTATVMAVV